MQPLVDLRELQAKWVVFAYLSTERVRPFHVSLKFCYIFLRSFSTKTSAASSSTMQHNTYNAVRTFCRYTFNQYI